MTFWIDNANTGVWVYDIARSSLARIAFGFDHTFPVWTPDGNRIAFSSSEGGAYNLFWKPADGSGITERLTTSPNDQMDATPSPDATMLLFTEQNRETLDDLWLLRLEGERKPEVFLQTSSRERQAAISPDGHWAAYASDESGRFEVYLTTFPDASRRWPASTGGGTNPRWSHDGRELFYRNGSSLLAVPVATDGELGTPARLFELDFATNFDVTPDGQRFVVVVPDGPEAPGPSQLNLVLNWGAELERLVPREN